MSEKKSDISDEKISTIRILRANKTSVETRGEPKPPTWLISFTDVIALMLTFFVLLYSMSNPEIEKWEQKIGMTDNSKAQFSGRQNKAGNDEGVNLNRLSFAQAENLDYLEILFEDVRADARNKNIVTMERTNTALMLSFSQSIFTQNGFDRDFLLFLNRLTPLLDSLDNRLVLTTTSDLDGGFIKLQRMGRILNEYGYDKSTAIQIRKNLGGQNNHLAIMIEPHDGRRME